MRRWLLVLLAIMSSATLVLLALYVYVNPIQLIDEYVGIFDVAPLLWVEIALIFTAAAGISMSPVAVTAINNFSQSRSLCMGRSRLLSER